MNMSEQIALLDRLTRFYQEQLTTQPELMAHWQNIAGILKPQWFRAFKVGLADGSIRDLLPPDKEGRQPFIVPRGQVFL